MPKPENAHDFILKNVKESKKPGAAAHGRWLASGHDLPHVEPRLAKKIVSSR
jgi:hypothetical protein